HTLDGSRHLVGAAAAARRDDEFHRLGRFPGVRSERRAESCECNTDDSNAIHLSPPPVFSLLFFDNDERQEFCLTSLRQPASAAPRLPCAWRAIYRAPPR